VFYASAKPEQLDDWLNQCAAQPRWIVWSDYTMFDCTHSRQTWQVLRQMYRELMPPDWEHYDQFWRVLDVWEAPVGSMRTKTDARTLYVRYKGRAMNASGRDDTALANAVLNAIAITLSLAAVHYGITVWDLTKTHLRHFMQQASVGIVGDDSLAWLPPSKANGTNYTNDDANAMRDEITRFGLIAKVAMSQRVEDAVFLGNRPYRVGDRWYWGPTIGRRIYKHHCRASVTGDPVAWLRGIALFEAQCYGFVPVIGAMARQVLALTAGHAITEYKTSKYDGDIEWSTRHAPAQPDRSTYFHAAVAYTQEPNGLGWSDGTVGPEELMALEATIATVQTLPAILGGPVLQQIMLVDDC
jgi:hypothetical protein